MDSILNVNVHVVLWFYQGLYNFFTIDDISEVGGITEQLVAESSGLI